MTARRTDRHVLVDRHVGNRLRLLRLERGMRRDELAAAIGVSGNQLSKYENGGNRMSPGRLLDIAWVLRVRLDHFFAEVSSIEGVKVLERESEISIYRRAETKELVRVWYQQDESRRAHLLAFLREAEQPRAQPLPVAGAAT